MCRGCAGDTGNYVHLCVFPQTSALPVTWRLMKDGYLIALDKRFCSRAWYCNGSAYIHFFALQMIVIIAQAGKQNRSLFVKFPLYKERSANNPIAKSVQLYIFYPFAMVIQKLSPSLWWTIFHNTDRDEDMYVLCLTLATGIIYIMSAASE